MSRLKAIEVRQIGKRYQLGERRPHYARLTEQLSGLFRRSGVDDEQASPDFWALRDVSFCLEPGETLGVIGRNGAGKSTLLKVLSRVTKPTTGHAVLRGRVGSLLEVGTGFHPELTGRENVFLNGAILGMRRREVLNRYEEIVDFAGIESFMDTPVKRYSSGMYMRLAFAVAAHLDTEILLVDEVLAVGDASFQSRSVGKMQDAAASGRTVVFVSHNMGSISSLCTTALYLRDGQVESYGAARGVLKDYLMQGVGPGGRVDLNADHVRPVAFTHIETMGTDELSREEFSFAEPICVRMGVEVREQTHGLYFTMILRTVEGLTVLMSDDRDSGERSYGMGRCTLDVEIPSHLLAPGQYYVTVGAASMTDGRLDHLDGVLQFSVHDYDRPRGDRRLGVIGTTLPWYVDGSP